MTEYGYDIGNAKLWRGEIEIPINSISREALEAILGGIAIVRCKDCRHRDPEDKRCDCGHGILWQLPRSDEWFCADGEAKERASDGTEST